MVDLTQRRAAREKSAEMRERLRRSSMRDRMGQIYFAEAVGTGRVKIGFAMHAAKRLVNVAVGCPVQLRLRALMDAPPAMEKELHSRFRSSWSHGEWFDITPELADLMAKYPTTDGRPTYCGIKPPAPLPAPPSIP